MATFGVATTPPNNGFCMTLRKEYSTYGVMHSREKNMKEISKIKFDAYAAYTRSPEASRISDEIRWYADENEEILGVVLHDLVDNDFAYIVLGRDLCGRFRAIRWDASLETSEIAYKQLQDVFSQLLKDDKRIFPQGDENGRQIDVFDPVVAPERLHPYFRTVLEKAGYSPARSILSEMVHFFRDVDGNFVQQFQTEGFNARLWELYLFAFLTEQGFLIDRSHASPDFMAIKYPSTVFFEALTVNPSKNLTKGDNSKQDVEPPPEEIQNFLKNNMPIKFGSALFSKIQKKYWELDHVKGHPLVFAIQDFLFSGSMTWTTTALPTYLYGFDQKYKYDENGALVISTEYIDKHEVGKKTIPSGFFNQPNSEYVSAVLFNSSGTLAKFNRMGFLAGFGSRNIKMVRKGTCYDHNPNSAAPKEFEIDVGSSEHSETWSEGLSIFHNPNAIHPVNPGLFTDIAHHFFENGQFVSYLPSFHPFGSVTYTKISE